jgi:hypothetical protein
MHSLITGSFILQSYQSFFYEIISFINLPGFIHSYKQLVARLIADWGSWLVYKLYQLHSFSRGSLVSLLAWRMLIYYKRFITSKHNLLLHTPNSSWIQLNLHSLKGSSSCTLQSSLKGNTHSPDDALLHLKRVT